MQATAVPRAGQEAMLAWLAAAAGDNSIRVTGGEVIPLPCLWIRLHVYTEHPRRVQMWPSCDPPSCTGETYAFFAREVCLLRRETSSQEKLPSSP